MQVVPRGRAQIDDFEAAFPYQEQPALSLPDYLVNASAANSQALSDLVIDKIATCAYARPIFVPHNQVVTAVSGGGSAVDNGALLKTGLPSLVWETCSVNNALGVLQMFSNRPWGFQEPDVIWNSSTEPLGFTLDATAKLTHATGGPSAANKEAQGVVFLLGRTVFHHVPVDGPSYMEVQWLTGFRRYSLRMGSHEFARLRVSEDDGATWVVLNPRMKVGSSVTQTMGNAAGEHAGAVVPVEILLANGCLQLTVGAQVTPQRVSAVGPEPGRAATLTVISGLLPLGTYTVSYAYVDAAGRETVPGKTAELFLSGTGGIHVALPAGLPAGVASVRYYVTGPWGTRRAGENAGGGLDITEPPDLSAPRPQAANTIPPVLNELRVLAGYFTQFTFSAHLLKWLPDPSLTSDPRGLGFAPDVTTPPFYVIHGTSGAETRASGAPWNVAFPAGASVTVTTASDPTDIDQQYTLAIANPVAGTYAGQSYADLTAVVTRVTTKVLGLFASPKAAAPGNIVPKRVMERADFDPMGLTVRRTVDVTVDNFHGQWADQQGNMALSLALGYLLPDTGLFTRFTGIVEGYCYSQPGANRATMRFQSVDRIQQLADFPLASPPDMDGWNHYYAMHFLAQAGGFVDSQIGFLSLVPDEPYQYAAGDTDPFFLPFGEGMRPWSPRNRTAPVLELANYIRQPTGFLLYVDQYGVLQYHQFIPPYAAAYTKAFTEGATGSDGSNLSEYWNPNTTKSTRQVRNEVLLIGIDAWSPDWNVLVSKRVDQDSIRHTTGRKPANYVGYRKPEVVVDSRYADPDFAALSADRRLAIDRVPELSVSVESWMQPGINPMDVITVENAKAGITGVPFYVLTTINDWSISEQEHRPVGAVIGRYLADAA